jgi:20S proteasome alpha/beta subunit
MSLVVTVFVQEGIVMASDSRLTLYNSEKISETENSRLAVAITDSVYKTFLAPNNVGISVCGQNDREGLLINGAVESFIDEVLLKKKVSVSQIPKLLLNYFLKKDYIPDFYFFVAGYKNQEQQVWRVALKPKEIIRVFPDKYGAVWAGETDVLRRLIDEVSFTDSENNIHKIPNCDIPWNFFTLQDAIDFAVFAIQSTIDSMRFQIRHQTVGGPIDVLVIKPNVSFWIKRKDLQVKN